MAWGGGERVFLLLLFSCPLSASTTSQHRGPEPDCSSKTCGGKSRANYPDNTTCPKTAVTNCHGGHHGFGNQLALLIRHYSWARRAGLEFCPTRWTTMDHLPNGSQMFDFVGGPNYGPPAAFDNAGSWAYRDDLDDLEEQTVRDIRSFYDRAQKPGAAQAHQVRRHRGLRGSKTFVWHVRGGDVKPPNASFITAGLKSLKKRYGKQMKSVDFISCGMPEHYQQITEFCKSDLGISCNVLLRHKCDDADRPGQQQMDELKEDFHRMAMADVFVYSASTLASCAAVLNSGKSHLDTDLAQGRNAHQSLRAKSRAWQAALAAECAVVPFAEQE